MPNIKPLYNEDREELWKVVPLQSPFSLFVEPSTYCSLHCKYCTHAFSKEIFEKTVRPYSFMSFEVFAAIVDQCASFSPKKLKLFEISGMGEPLLHPQIQNMVAYLKASGITNHVRMITNALAVNEKTPDILRAGVDVLRISLQGITNESYERICGLKIDFSKLKEKILYLCKNRGNTKIYIKNIDIALTEDEREQFLEEFGSIADRVFIEKIIPFFNDSKIDELIESGTALTRYSKNFIPVEVCPQTFTGLVINVNGDISMCGKEIGPIYLGNVLETTLPEAWASEKRRDFLAMHLRKERRGTDVKPPHPMCGACQIPEMSLSSPFDILDNYSEIILSRLLEGNNEI